MSDIEIYDIALELEGTVLIVKLLRHDYQGYDYSPEVASIDLAPAIRTVLATMEKPHDP